MFILHAARTACFVVFGVTEVFNTKPLTSRRTLLVSHKRNIFIKIVMTDCLTKTDFFLQTVSHGDVMLLPVGFLPSLNQTWLTYKFAGRNFASLYFAQWSHGNMGKGFGSEIFSLK